MEEYKIYCTEEQTKKAMKLGAPIEETPMMDIIRNEIGEHCLLQGSNVYWYPTAEQMIGWLEEDNSILGICIRYDYGWFYEIRLKNAQGKYSSTFHSRKEATLAVINAALDYKINRH